MLKQPGMLSWQILASTVGVSAVALPQQLGCSSAAASGLTGRVRHLFEVLLAPLSNSQEMSSLGSSESSPPRREARIESSLYHPKLVQGMPRSKVFLRASFSCREERIGEQLEMLKAAQSQADSGAVPETLEQTSDSLPTVSFAS